MTSGDQRAQKHQVTLLELVDRVLNRGVVISGDVTLSVADGDLVYVGLRMLLSLVGTLGEQQGQVAAGGGT